MSKLHKKPSALKKGHPTRQNKNFYQFFSTFVGHLCPPGSGSGFWIRIHWPDWIRIQSGYETLFWTELNCSRFMGLQEIKLEGTKLVNKTTSSQYFVEARCFDSMLLARLRTLRCKKLGQTSGSTIGSSFWKVTSFFLRPFFTALT